jgi:hypothetical protein
MDGWLVEGGVSWTWCQQLYNPPLRTCCLRMQDLVAATMSVVRGDTFAHPSERLRLLLATLGVGCEVLVTQEMQAMRDLHG